MLILAEVSKVNRRLPLSLTVTFVVLVRRGMSNGAKSVIGRHLALGEVAKAEY